MVEKSNENKGKISNFFEEMPNSNLRGKIKLVDDLEDFHKLRIGCSNIDNILQGGFNNLGVHEINGRSGVGKTQICLQLCLMAQLPAKYGGLSKGVIYICTEDRFPLKRLKQLSAAFSCKYCTDMSTNFEDNIYIQKIIDYDSFEKCLKHEIPELLIKIPIGLIIIDSIAGLFRSENFEVDYINRGKDFLSIIRNLNKLCKEFDLIIVCTNQVTDNIDTNETEPCLGLAWSNLINYRHEISRLNFEASVRQWDIVFGPDLPKASCTFEIGMDGLQ